MQVPFFDAKANYQNHKKMIDDSVQQVLHSGSYINGAQVAEFSANLASYLNVSRVVPCANGTDALTLALMALTIKPGDEVIVPTFNFISAAESVALLGAIPVFVDAEKASFNMDCTQIEQKITHKTKAIIAVHLFGLASAMEKIMQIAAKYQLFVIEDVAQALGANYLDKKLGTIGHIGCTSFFPTKNLACFGDGGAVFTNDDHLSNQIKLIANHGQAAKYQHQVIGLNSRLDTIQAAILNVHLTTLDDMIAQRRAIATRYYEALKHLKSVQLPNDEEGNHTFNKYTILLESKTTREQLQTFLKERGISTMVYYPLPNHLQLAFENYGYQKGDFPIAEELCEKVLALPIFPSLTVDAQQYIISQIEDFFK